MQLTQDFLTQAQAVIEEVVRKNRPELLKLHGNVETTFKADKTVVTALDKQMETELRVALLRFDAGIGIEGEEFGIEGSRETFWLVDPIDGTESFVRGLPFVRNMVTLIDAGQPVFAFVYRPISDDLFVARQGHGTTRNGEPVHVSHRPLERMWIELHGSFNKSGAVEIIQALQQSINGFRISDFTYVAEGKMDGFLIYKSGGGPWDFAPRALLVSEAGGRVTNLDGDKYDYRKNSMLAANPLVFDDLMAIIKNQLPD